MASLVIPVLSCRQTETDDIERSLPNIDVRRGKDYAGLELKCDLCYERATGIVLILCEVSKLTSALDAPEDLVLAARGVARSSLLHYSQRQR